MTITITVFLALVAQVPVGIKAVPLNLPSFLLAGPASFPPSGLYCCASTTPPVHYNMAFDPLKPRFNVERLLQPDPLHSDDSSDSPSSPVSQALPAMLESAAPASLLFGPTRRLLISDVASPAQMRAGQGSMIR
ncbi:hypothetical protein GALMADRAFT_883232 [Galerina marginata CBS 339.88]|uniref:Secreted protein n=1 Tax=Galerina marginata (strain CBS 339.88) TaxID=685588 RepID=A0A067SHE2_GALM3|nr:hypothetical protein GALMADRAFT_883232 [Galerina marginata CBS 339.88]